MYSNTSVNLVLVWMMSCNVTTLACFKVFSNDASRIAVKGVPSSELRDISFKATSWPVCLKCRYDHMRWLAKTPEDGQNVLPLFGISMYYGHVSEHGQHSASNITVQALFYRLFNSVF